MKTCRSCSESKPLTEYYTRYSICKVCKNEQNKQWSFNNPDKVKQQRRKTRLKTNYNLTELQYAEMLVNQNGCCALCKGTDENKHLAVDHCHATGKVRGLLCINCNTLLGKVHDDILLLQNMIDYLNLYKEKQN